MIVIAGTGSIAYGRNAKVRLRAPAAGDSPSLTRAPATGSAAPPLPPLCGAWDEDPDRTLRLIERLMKSWRLQTIEQLVPAANATPPPDFAALFPAVLSLADSGDRIARDVLTQAGAHLANLAGIVLRRLFPHSEAVPVAMSGGVFGSSALVRQVFYNSRRISRRASFRCSFRSASSGWSCRPKM